MRTVIYPVRDVAAAKNIYNALLGVDPDMDEPYYVGYTAPGQHIGLDPNGHAKGMNGPVGYWHVDDLETALKSLVTNGASEHESPRDVGGGRLVASVTDVDGNVIGLIQEA
jgi:predicted enzyme related to lactoylglutathione lyase